ncbi:MAG: PaaI family thioesterase [Alphaproteobacteria bacterium]
MTDDEILQALRERGRTLQFMRYLDGVTDSVSQHLRQAILRFHPKADLCQTAGVIQGGFVTAMLDAAMAQSVMVASQLSLGPPTLELKVSFFRAAIPGPHMAIGRVLRMGKSIGFLEAELFNDKHQLIAKSSATAMLVPAPQ